MTVQIIEKCIKLQKVKRQREDSNYCIKKKSASHNASRPHNSTANTNFMKNYFG